MLCLGQEGVASPNMVVDTRVQLSLDTGRQENKEGFRPEILLPPVKAFLLAKKVEGCTKATLDSYNNHLAHFMAFVGKPIGDAARTDIEQYLLDHKERGCSPHYISSCYRNLSAFFNWLAANDFLATSPMKNIKRRLEEAL